MIDFKKRRTLKLLSLATGGLATGGLATGGLPAIASSASNSATPCDATKQSLLEIQIITGRTATEDTIIFVNRSNHVLKVSRFLPQYIALDGEMLNMNQLLNNSPLTIKPQYPQARKDAKWQPLNLNESGSYLWVEPSSVPLLSQSAAATGVITINAAVVNEQALLTLAAEPGRVYS